MASACRIRNSVTVSVTGKLTAYNRAAVNNTASALLSNSARQTLGKNYHEQDTPTVGALSVVEVTRTGVIYLSVPVRGTWVYALSPQQINTWPQYIRGATSTAALAYLNTQPGVASVEIRLPFGADHLPTSMDEIRIALVGGNGPSS